MPRNSSGTYTLPESAFVSGTVIRSSPVNNDLSDVATALTQSLATTGVSTMTGPIKAASGSQSAPSYTFASAQGTGFYLSGTNEFAWVANGILGATFKSDLSVTWVGNATYSGNLTVSGTFATSATTFTATTDPILTLNNTTNNSAEHEIFRLKLGDGTGAQASRRVIGSGANNITEIRDYVGTTKALVITSNGLSLIGYADLPEIAAPSAPSANTIRFYVVDEGGTSNAAFIDASGSVSGLRNAVQADMETATSNLRTVTPGVQHFHPAHAKAAALVSSDGSLILNIYNVSSASRSAAGRYGVFLSTALANTNYIAFCNAYVDSAVVGNSAILVVSASSSSQIAIYSLRAFDGSDKDTKFGITVYGDM